MTREDVAHLFHIQYLTKQIQSIWLKWKRSMGKDFRQLSFLFFFFYFFNGRLFLQWEVFGNLSTIAIQLLRQWQLTLDISLVIFTKPFSFGSMLIISRAEVTHSVPECLEVEACDGKCVSKSHHSSKSSAFKWHSWIIVHSVEKCFKTDIVNKLFWFLAFLNAVLIIPICQE